MVPAQRFFVNSIFAYCSGQRKDQIKPKTDKRDETNKSSLILLVLQLASATCFGTFYPTLLKNQISKVKVKVPTFSHATKLVRTVSTKVSIIYAIWL